MTDRDPNSVRPFEEIRNMDPRDLTPRERFLMRVSDWGDSNSIVIVKRGDGTPVEPEPIEPVLSPVKTVDRILDDGTIVFTDGTTAVG